MAGQRAPRRCIGRRSVFTQPRGEPFYTLARAIVGQQISVKAAQSVWERFVALTSGSGKRLLPADVLALGDLLHQARLVNSRTFQTDEVFFWAAVGYLILTLLATFTVRALEKRYAIHR